MKNLPMVTCSACGIPKRSCEFFRKMVAAANPMCHVCRKTAKIPTGARSPKKKAKPIKNAPQRRSKLVRRATEAETKLLRALQVMWEGNPIQWEFQKPVGPFYADFAILGVRVIAEIDGGYHMDPMQQAYDARRTAYLEKFGWRVLRFTNERVMGDVMGVVKELSATFGLSI